MALKSIGGYFELESRFESEYYPGLIRLNTGRNCLEYILRARNYRKIYVPQYCCTVVMEPVLKLNLEYEMYSINFDLEVQEVKQMQKDECFLVVNYFGIKGKYITSLSKEVDNLIVDNSQAFFEAPIAGVDTFYSARKFFGVPDGAYLSTDCYLDEDFPQEVSWKRCEHLVRRLENGANDGYPGFLKNERYLYSKKIKTMSNFTYRLLAGINYRSVKTRRNQNFQYLHLKLRSKNKLTLDTEVDGPMVYPLYVEKGRIRDELIRQNIYVATYWPSVLEQNSPESLEYKLAQNLLPLPIDQRYGLLDMDRICNVLNTLL